MVKKVITTYLLLLFMQSLTVEAQGVFDKKTFDNLPLDTNLYISLEGVSGGNISKSILVSADTLTIKTARHEIENKYKLAGFEFVSYNKGDIYQQRNEGTVLNASIRKFIKSVLRGQKIWLENIVVEDENQKQIRLKTQGYVVE